MQTKGKFFESWHSSVSVKVAKKEKTFTGLKTHRP